MLTEDARSALRSSLRARRLALSVAQRMAAADGVLGSLSQLAEFQVDERIAGYWAIAGELPLHRVVADLTRRGQHYFLPCIRKQRRLAFARWTSGADMQANRLGIPEPVCAAKDLVVPGMLDVVLVPLLGFDRSGHRLGYGGGYYDTSFAFLRDRTEPESPVLVGVGYAMQEVDSIESHAHDVRLDYIATENELIECKAGQA
jgi:5-formyltetrahydrofolate cyclo-ligase